MLQSRLENTYSSFYWHGLVDILANASKVMQKLNWQQVESKSLCLPMLPNRVESPLAFQPELICHTTHGLFPHYLASLIGRTAELPPWSCLPQLLRLAMLQVKPGRSLVGMLSFWRTFIVGRQGESTVGIHVYTGCRCFSSSNLPI